MRAQVKFTPADDALLLRLYPNTANKEIMALAGWTVSQLKNNSKRLNCKKTRECKARTAGQTVWPAEKIQFIRDNYFLMTNRQLAVACGVKLTILRNKTRELGLKNYDLQYWTAEQADLLVANYKTVGDQEIAEMLQLRWPREKAWTKRVVRKKRAYLNLMRTPEESNAIFKKHLQPGGKCDTIATNSASTNLPDRYIANFITRDPALKDELVKHPDIIELKRAQVKLNRAIKAAKL